MNLLSIAIPFFLLALLLELLVDRVRSTGYYRLNDAVGSMSTGALNTTFGLFTKLLEVAIYGFVLEHFALNRLDLSLFDASLRGIALWLFALLLWDFCYYWAHRFGHEVGLFWAAHAVHHQSEDYNLSTALRQTSTGFLFGWVFYVPMFLLGIPVEVVATVAAIDLIYQFWVHTQHIDRLGWADRVFVTPSNHRVHHAQNDRYLDRNYGGILIVWDRLFGTFQDELADDPPVYGVRKPLHRFNPFVANLQVYAGLLRDTLRTRRWRDKLALWMRPPAFRPADLPAHPPPNLDEFRKFDPPLAAPLKRYILLQFVVAAVMTGTVAIAFPVLPIGSTLAICAVLWLLLANIGALNEGLRNGVYYEALRLLLVGPAAVGYLLLRHSDVVTPGPAVTAVALYTLVSLLLLRGAARSVGANVTGAAQAA